MIYSNNITHKKKETDKKSGKNPQENLLAKGVDNRYNVDEEVGKW
jgi:hypothetical protein